MPVGLIHALAIVKQAAAQVNARHNLDQKIASAIEHAAVAIQSGELDDQFPLVIWQTRYGTQSNMNVNEVTADYPNEQLNGKRGRNTPVHPHEHVNPTKSSNYSSHTATTIPYAPTLHHHSPPALSSTPK